MGDDRFVPGYLFLPWLGLDADRAALDELKRVFALDCRAIDLCTCLVKPLVLRM